MLDFVYIYKNTFTDGTVDGHGAALLLCTRPLVGWGANFKLKSVLSCQCLCQSPAHALLSALAPPPPRERSTSWPTSTWGPRRCTESCGRSGTSLIRVEDAGVTVTQARGGTGKQSNLKRAVPVYVCGTDT
eukprot:3426448-Rhodomonas_salina.1